MTIIKMVISDDSRDEDNKNDHDNAIYHTNLAIL